MGALEPVGEGGRHAVRQHCPGRLPHLHSCVGGGRMMDDTRLAVAALLGETAQAHHQAYAATDGFDPEWPWWYAERLVDPLGDLGVAVTKSRIVFVLVGAAGDLP